MQEKSGNLNTDGSPSEQQSYSLNDDRRVKVLSPGALVAKRFFRNRLAVLGLTMLVAMFLFSFVGGLISPYGQEQQFFTTQEMEQEFVGFTENADWRYVIADGQKFDSILQAQFLLAQSKKNETFTFKEETYSVKSEGEGVYTISKDGTELAVASKDIYSVSDGEAEPSSALKFAALKAFSKKESSFTTDGKIYQLTEGDVMDGDKIIGYIGRLVVRSATPGVVVTRDFKEKLAETVAAGSEEFIYTDETGESATYSLSYAPDTKIWSVKQTRAVQVYARYSRPSSEHWLGTDTSGMDMLTRLMYGGRVSLVIGFIVVFISAAIGVALGGISGYFGGWVDNLIMRVVDVFYCIPSLPMIIILGSAMDAMQVDPQVRMLYLMLILGFLGWPGIARMVRGQILSLREQDFMIAAEASGIRASRRIFRHLIPNVIPQLIVTCTMSLGSTIITEATLSFLGLGVKFPFASWGNIINDVNNAYVMTNYLFIWIPAGICLLITVLGFNFVGDGLRDAFDPKMKQ